MAEAQIEQTSAFHPFQRSAFDPLRTLGLKRSATALGYEEG
jgi:hypothetical protein